MNKKSCKRIRENSSLEAAVKPYLDYYVFCDTDEAVEEYAGVDIDDLTGFRIGDVEDGCTFVGHLFAKDDIDTPLNILLVFEKDGEYIVGTTIGGIVYRVSLDEVQVNLNYKE